MIKVVIAEDEKRIREGLVGAVPWSELGYEVSGSAPNGLLALDLVRRLEPALLVTDIRMPKMDGLQLLKEAREAFPKLRVVILSGYGEFAYAQQAIKYGASEFLLKPVSEEELVAVLERLRQAIREEDSASLPALLRSQTEGEGRGGGSRLMRRIESYVERNYRRDLPVKEVADFVGLSPNYFSHLFKQERGCSFVDYVNAVRIAAACRLLEESGLKVYEIAEEVGFTDYKYFSTVFRKITGDSPTKYRPEAENIQ